MDKAPDPKTAALRDAAVALRQAAAVGEHGRHPFARTRFRVVLTGKTRPVADGGHDREGGR